MNPNQDNQYGGGVPQPPVGEPQQNPYAQQPAAPVQPAMQTPTYPSSPAPEPSSSSAPLGLISLGLGAAAVISLPLLAAYVSSLWILLIPLVAGAASATLAIISSKKSSLTGIVVLSIALGATVSVISFTQLTQGLISQQRMESQLEDLREGFNIDLPSASGGSGSSSDRIDDALERSREQIESMRRMNEQLGN